MMKLIDNARDWHKFASVRLGMLAGLIAAYFAQYPDQWAAFVAMFPEPVRPMVGLALFVAAAGTRVVSFKGKSNV